MDARTEVQSDTGVNAASPYTRTIVLTRLFDAPRALVWQVWTDPVHLAQWFGPHMFTNHNVSVDPRVGGTLRLTMRSPEGSDYPMACVFREVKAPERLVFTNNALDDKGNLLLDGLTTVMFESVGPKTKITLEHTATGTAEVTKFMLGGMAEGWSQSFEKMTGYLPNVG